MSIRMDQIQPLIDREYDYLMSEHPHWSLTKGDQDLELVAHALRVLLHNKTTPQHLAEYLALVDCQHPDGGWGKMSSDKASAAWVSAFCALMLIRGNLLLNHSRVAEAVRKCVRYFLETQKEDGKWSDPSWADLDAVSHPISFFDVFLAVGKNLVDAATLGAVKSAWRKGMQFMLERQAADGGWYDPEFHPTGVEITAHLIQDSIVADLVLGNELNVTGSCRGGVRKLLSVQAADGSWDGENVDHSMDCTRSLMLVCSILGIRAECDRAIERGLEWILKQKCERGWPDFPGMESNLERTCDGLDTLLKYKAYSQPVTTAIVKLWGYAV
jgi:squalene cyclase